MPPKRFPSDDPREWLNRARSNLAYAKGKTRGVYFEELCFQAQQAAEKALKAVCLKRNIQFPRTHNLVDLIRILEEKSVFIPADVREAGRQKKNMKRPPDWPKAWSRGRPDIWGASKYPVPHTRNAENARRLYTYAAWRKRPLD